MTEWFYIGAIFAQSAILFYCGYVLRRSGNMIDELSRNLSEASKLLGEASDTIKRLQDEVKMLRVLPGSKVVTDINELPYEMRAGLREKLAQLLGEMRKRDN